MARTGSDLLFSIRTGKPAFDEAFGMPFFDWLASHPESEEGFHV
jgi:hypothetical protein